MSPEQKPLRPSGNNPSLPPGRTTPVPGRADRDRRVRQHERMSRVLKLLSLIQSRGRWNAKAISQELECSERTVFRDLEVLEFAGVPWYFDEADGCYRVRPDYRFPTLGLTEEETLGQAVATQLSSAAGLSAGGTATSTTRKLAAGSSEEVQQTLADAANLIKVLDLKLADHSSHHGAIRTAQFALLRGRKLTGTYDSPHEATARKLVLHPYRLCLIKAAWYLVGHLDKEPSPKTFRAARFKTLRMLDEPASIPEGFDLRGYLGNAWAVYRGETSYDVELRFIPQAADLVTETVWHHTQQVTRHRDGSATLEFRVDGLNEILHWLLSWASRVKVVGPEELKLRYFQALEDALELNSKS